MRSFLITAIMLSVAFAAHGHELGSTSELSLEGAPGKATSPEAKQNIGELGAALPFLADALAESKTWKFRTFKLNTSAGYPTADIKDATVTVVRADKNGKIVCYWTIAWDISVNGYGWKTSKPVPLELVLKNSSGGVLKQISASSFDFDCSMVGHPMSFTAGFDPDIYDEIASVGLIFRGTTIRKC